MVAVMNIQFQNLRTGYLAPGIYIKCMCHKNTDRQFVSSLQLHIFKVIR